MKILNQESGAVNGVSETAFRFGVVTAPGLTRTEADRLQGAFERAASYARRFAAILPKVREVAPDFAAKLEAVPADLTGYDFGPLFEESEQWGGDCHSAVAYRGKMWAPDLDNLGESYNGPIGDQMEPFPRFPEMWQLAKRQAEAQKLADFAAAMDRDCELVTRDLKGDALGIATCSLLRLAFGVEGQPGPDCFADSQTDEMPANLAALRLIRVALDELNGMCANSVIDRREWVREELVRVEAISREMGFAPVLEVETPDAE